MSVFLVVLLPLILAPLIYYSGIRQGGRAGHYSSLLIASGLGLIISYFPQVVSEGHVEWKMVWGVLAGFPLDMSLRVDGFSIVYAFCIAAVSLAVCLYSVSYMQHRFEEMGMAGGEGRRASAQYYLLYLLFYSGMMGTVVSTNVIQFYIFYEFILISTWLLIQSFGYGDRVRIALNYFIWTHISGILILVGFIAHYMGTGSIALDSYGVLTSAMPFLLLGFAIKMAVFGLHTWLPLAHGEAPTPISALLSPVTIGIGAYGIIRFAMPLITEVSVWLTLWSLVTIAYGGLLAFSEDDIKRLLAYSSISHMGYMLLGIASVTWIGLAGVSFHYASHAFLKGVLFMTAGLIMMQFRGNRKISLMGGLASKVPMAALFIASGFLGLAGMPPFSGFNSKLMILAGAYGTDNWLALVFVIGATLSSFLTLAYGALVFKRSMMGEEKGESPERADPIMLISIAFLLALSIVFFLVPSLVLLPLLG